MRRYIENKKRGRARTGGFNACSKTTTYQLLANYRHLNLFLAKYIVVVVLSFFKQWPYPDLSEIKSQASFAQATYKSCILTQVIEWIFFI